ncbi:MAG: hypothetical protein LBF59_04530, partial [Prevotellaceae bacterium]|nr:hypothetical protein [Prevotellaceae bacterium]
MKRYDMRKMRKSLYLVVFLCVFSCKNDEVVLHHIDVSQATTLASPETLYSFTDKYAIGVSVRDTVAFVMQAKSDTSLTAINIKTKSIIQSFGVSGYGPNDICDPIFMSSIDYPDVLLQDSRLVNKFHKIDFDGNLNRYTVSKFMIYPVTILPSAESNISKNFISGRKIGEGEKMFYIYDRNKDSVIIIDYYPPMNLNKELDLNHIYAPSVSLNEGKNRIIIGMYYFDMFQVYDLSGNRLKTCCLSDNCIPKFYKSDNMQTVLRQCEKGLIRSFATRDYCYFLRITRDFSSDDDTNPSTLIQINWDGELINAYHITDEVLGHFYIDEQSRKMYIVRHRLVPDIYVNEVYDIVSYQ